MFHTFKARAAALAVIALSAAMVLAVGDPASAAGNADNAKALKSRKCSPTTVAGNRS